MIPDIEVLSVGWVNFRQVRFVRSPLTMPDLPWHVVSDMHAALGLPPALSRQLKRGMKKAWASDSRKVRVGGEVELIASHSMAQGVIGAAVDCATAPAFVDLQYREAGMAATGELMRALGLSGEQATGYVVAAVNGGEQRALPSKIDPATGQRVYNLADIQAALGLSDEEMARTVENATGLGLRPIPVDPDKLETVH